MKINRYFTIVAIAVVGCLLFTADASAQRRHSYRGRGYYRPYYPPRVYAYNRPFVSIRFGSVGYRYQQGYFYRPYGSVFRVTIPPFGVRIATLPAGYRSFNVGPDPYYYYNGTYYRTAPNKQYEVVAPPLGATVSELPPGAKATVIDGNKYYVLDGTYYEESITNNNELLYTVVGTDGVLNTTESIPDEPQMGDRFDTLPADAKAVVIQGEKLYSTPSGYYYKEVMDGNKIYYEIVGK
jgi:hypothetical protein